MPDEQERRENPEHEREVLGEQGLPGQEGRESLPQYQSRVQEDIERGIRAAAASGATPEELVRESVVRQHLSEARDYLDSMLGDLEVGGTVDELVIGRLEEVRDTIEDIAAVESRVTPRATPFTVSLDGDAYRTAEVLAQQRGTSISQLLRMAVTTQRWFDDVRTTGRRILVEERRGKLREIIEIREQTRDTRG